MTNSQMALLKRILEEGMPVIVFLSVLAAGIILRKIIFFRLSSWAKQAKSHLDDIIIRSAAGPFLAWCLMLGLFFAFKSSRLHPEVVRISGKILLAAGILSISWVLGNISTKIIRGRYQRSSPGLAVTSLTENFSRVVIFAIGILVILNSLGISVTPILATLGVGGLAVALALQDTLSNFFAGFYITANRQIKIGDYIKLESSEEGYVTDINWRTTKIRNLSGNLILVPNLKLTQAIITNFSLPERRISFGVDLSVDYAGDLQRIEAVTREVAEEVMKGVPGGVPEFKPGVMYKSFGPYCVNLGVTLQAGEFSAQYLVKHEFIKRLKERYQKEGIVPAYPVQKSINIQG